MVPTSDHARAATDADVLSGLRELALELDDVIIVYDDADQRPAQAVRGNAEPRAANDASGYAAAVMLVSAVLLLVLAVSGPSGCAGEHDTEPAPSPARVQAAWR